MGASRALGAILCIACVAVAAAHIYFGYVSGTRQISLAFALPITVGLLVVVGLGFWLGWIMVTTREAAPPAPPAPETPAKSEKAEK